MSWLPDNVRQTLEAAVFCVACGPKRQSSRPRSPRKRASLQVEVEESLSDSVHQHDLSTESLGSHPAGSDIKRGLSPTAQVVAHIMSMEAQLLAGADQRAQLQERVVNLECRAGNSLSSDSEAWDEIQPDSSRQRGLPLPGDAGAGAQCQPHHTTKRSTCHGAEAKNRSTDVDQSGMEADSSMKEHAEPEFFSLFSNSTKRNSIDVDIVERRFQDEIQEEISKCATMRDTHAELVAQLQSSNFEALYAKARALNAAELKVEELRIHLDIERSLSQNRKEEHDDAIRGSAAALQSVEADVRELRAQLGRKSEVDDGVESEVGELKNQLQVETACCDRRLDEHKQELAESVSTLRAAEADVDSLRVLLTTERESNSNTIREQQGKLDEHVAHLNFAESKLEEKDLERKAAYSLNQLRMREIETLHAELQAHIAGVGKTDSDATQLREDISAANERAQNALKKVEALQAQIEEKDNEGALTFRSETSEAVNRSRATSCLINDLRSELTSQVKENAEFREVELAGASKACFRQLVTESRECDRLREEVAKLKVTDQDEKHRRGSERVEASQEILIANERTAHTEIQLEAIKAELSESFEGYHGQLVTQEAAALADAHALRDELSSAHAHSQELMDALQLLRQEESAMQQRDSSEVAEMRRAEVDSLANRRRSKDR